jgi:SAM-dependent methyltransferase
VLSKEVVVEAASIVEPSDALRAHLHAMWGSVAGSWADHADYVDARSASLTEKLLASAAPQPGARVLELACGAGGLGLAAARRVAPGGEVVLSDVAAEMTAIAAARAEALGVTNVSARVLDLERIEEPDGSYDVVLCREGLMFALDPALAAGEIARVLRPGGRAAIGVWGPRERNPWLGLLFDAVSAQVGGPMPPPGIPGPFSLSDASELAEVLSGAGLSDVAVEEAAVPLKAGSFDEWWTRATSLAGPLVKVLAAMPDEARTALRAGVREAVKDDETAEGGLELPGVALLASASCKAG